jgi:hypothetical protein
MEMCSVLFAVGTKCLNIVAHSLRDVHKIVVNRADPICLSVCLTI